MLNKVFGISSRGNCFSIPWKYLLIQCAAGRPSFCSIRPLDTKEGPFCLGDDLYLLSLATLESVFPLSFGSSLTVCTQWLRSTSFCFLSAQGSQVSSGGRSLAGQPMAGILNLIHSCPKVSHSTKIETAQSCLWMGNVVAFYPSMPQGALITTSPCCGSHCFSDLLYIKMWPL